jgi:hypothetical protein
VYLNNAWALILNVARLKFVPSEANLFTHQPLGYRQGTSLTHNMCLMHAPRVSLTQLQLDSGNGGLFTPSRVMPLKRMNRCATKQPGFCEQLINSGYTSPTFPASSLHCVIIDEAFFPVVSSKVKLLLQAANIPYKPHPLFTQICFLLCSVFRVVALSVCSAL